MHWTISQVSRIVFKSLGLILIFFIAGLDHIVRAVHFVRHWKNLRISPQYHFCTNLGDLLCNLQASKTCFHVAVDQFNNIPCVSKTLFTHKSRLIWPVSWFGLQGVLQTLDSDWEKCQVENLLSQGMLLNWSTWKHVLEAYKLHKWSPKFVQKWYWGDILRFFQCLTKWTALPPSSPQLNDWTATSHFQSFSYT